MKEIGAFAAKTNFSKILAELASGDEVIITKRGVKIAVLTPILPEDNLPSTKAKSYAKKVMLNQKENFVDFMLRSPLAEANLKLRRDNSLPRDIVL